MTKEYFNTKEDYLLFRKQFAAAVNHKKAKSHLEPCDEWLSSSDEYSKGTGTHRVDGWMTATHFIFLNIVRGLPPRRGFVPITNKIKLENCYDKWEGFNNGYNELKRVAKIAKMIRGDKSNVRSWHESQLDNFLTPFLEGGSTLMKNYEAVMKKHNPFVERYVNILAKIPLEGCDD